MKKLLFALAIFATGLVSAKGSIEKNGTKVKPFESKNLIIKKQLKGKKALELNMLRYAWIGIQTACGQTYYLDLNMYCSVEELASDIAYFNDQKCPQPFGQYAGN